MLTASFLALGHRFALGVGSCDAGNGGTRLGSPGAGRGQWLCLVWGLGGGRHTHRELCKLGVREGGGHDGVWGSLWLGDTGDALLYLQA